MDLNELKTLAAKHFGIEVEKVSDAHVTAIKGIHDELVAKELPNADEATAHAKAIEQMEKDFETEKTAKIEAERELAEYKTRPPVDAHADDPVLGRIKSLPDITTAVLDETEGEADIRAFRKQWDTLHMLSTVSGKVGENGHRPVSSLKYWDMLRSRFPQFTDAISKSIDTATTAEGSQWAPTLYSTDMQESIYDETTVAKQFPRIRSPKQVWVLPFSPTGGTVYKAGETTTIDPAWFTETTPTSAARTITAVKLLCRVAWSDEFDEESIVAAAPMFRDHTIRLVSEAIDSAIMNGDTTATHMDTGKSFTSVNAETAFDGLRDIAKNGMSNSKDLTLFNADNVLALIDAGTERFILDPKKLVIFTSPKIRGKWMNIVDNNTNKNLVYMRSTPMGDDLAKMGALVDFYGTPVIPTATLWANMPATGLYTTSGAYTAIVWCRKDAFVLTDRKELGAILVDQPFQGLKDVLTSWRGAFTALHGSTSATVYAGYGYGIAV